MLDEQEWAEIEPLLVNRIVQIQEHRRVNGSNVRQAIEAVDSRDVLEQYRELTGFHETNVNAIWHHRLRDYGPPCTSCRKLLRTPRAKFCAACGTRVS